MNSVHLSMHELSELVVMQAQRGRSRSEIIRTLVARGWPEISAVRFVDTTLNEYRAREAEAQAPEESDDEQPSTRRDASRNLNLWRMLWLTLLIAAIIILACLLVL
jgi:hypothetical protein